MFKLITLNVAGIHENSNFITLFNQKEDQNQQNQSNTKKIPKSNWMITTLITMDLGGRLDLNFARTTPLLP